MKILNLYKVHFGFEDQFICNVKACSEEEAIEIAHERVRRQTLWCIEPGIQYHTKVETILENCVPNDENIEKPFSFKKSSEPHIIPCTYKQKIFTAFDPNLMTDEQLKSLGIEVEDMILFGEAGDPGIPDIVTKDYHAGKHFISEIDKKDFIILCEDGNPRFVKRNYFEEYYQPLN